ncbi:hypothetical protein BSKO_03098 [Bryopsis sp. KO-2023]|nr:hypothetical protein BSKO_03098 [Bryopsis sp. KO-2023]
MIGMISPPTRFTRSVVGDGFARQNRFRVQRAVRGRRVRSIVRSSIAHEIDGSVVKVRPTNPRFATALTIDGGGVRGLIPAAVLEVVEKAIIDHIKENDLLPEEAKGKKIEVDLADYFNCISGTSVGSIVALYLASKGGDCAKLFEEYGWDDIRCGSVEGIVKLIEKRAEDVFPPPWYQNIPLVGDLLGYLLLIFFPKFSATGVEKVLQDAFGEMTLKDAKTGLLVPTFEITKNQAFSFWSSSDGTGYAAVKTRAEPKTAATASKASKKPEEIVIVPGEDEAVKWDPDIEFVGGHDYKLWQVARASSAAPTFFPSSSFSPVGGGAEKTFIDGGVVANNPTMQSVAFIETKVGRLENLAVLSLGTGHAQPKTAGLDNAGAFGWVIKGNLISILMDGSSEYLQSLVDLMYYKVKGLPPGQYVRISTCVDQGNKDTEVLSEMDNPENAERLVEIGGELGATYEEPIKEFVEKFMFAEA